MNIRFGYRFSFDELITWFGSMNNKVDLKGNIEHIVQERVRKIVKKERDKSYWAGVSKQMGDQAFRWQEEIRAVRKGRQQIQEINTKLVLSDASARKEIATLREALQKEVHWRHNAGMKIQKLEQQLAITTRSENQVRMTELKYLEDMLYLTDSQLDITSYIFNRKTDLTSS